MNSFVGCFRDDLVGPCVNQVEAGFDKYLMHSNGNPLVYDKVTAPARSMTDGTTLPNTRYPPLVQ